MGVRDLNDRVVITERVYWSDVDKLDVMYFGNYIRFMERAEAEFFRARGISYDAILERYGIWLPRVHVSFDFRRPARLDDELTAWAELVKVGGSTLHFHFPIERSGERLADGKLILAAIDRSFKSVRLPAELVEIIQGRSAAGG